MYCKRAVSATYRGENQLLPLIKKKIQWAKGKQFAVEWNCASLLNSICRDREIETFSRFFVLFFATALLKEHINWKVSDLFHEEKLILMICIGRKVKSSLEKSSISFFTERVKS